MLGYQNGQLSKVLDSLDDGPEYYETGDKVEFKKNEI